MSTEFELIRRLTQRTELLLPPQQAGAGDDCAVIPASALGFNVPHRFLLVTNDALVEDVHFRRRYYSGKDLGWKTLAVSLSDIAAMGGTPYGAVLSLHLPADCDEEYLTAVYDGFAELGHRTQTAILGGDTVRSPVLSISLTLFGSSAAAPLLRSGMAPGDELWLSGSIGGSYCGLQILEGRLEPKEFSEEVSTMLKQKNLRPEPRLLLGKLLMQRNLASAAIDVSDGVLADAGHLIEASGLSAELELERIPYEAGAIDAGLDLADLLTGGEDYELLFSAPPRAREALEALSGSIVKGERLPPLTRIGRVEAPEEGADLFIRQGKERITVASYLAAAGRSERGWRHF